MPIFIPILLLAWVPFVVALRWKWGSTKGLLTAVLAGWAVLPNEVYSPAMIEAGKESAGWAHATCLATAPYWNKASAIGLGCLLALIIFDGPALRRLRLRGTDVLLLIFVATPLASAWSNGLSLASALMQSRHLVLAWGVPYLVGRTLFSESAALLDLARAWALAGLLTAPFSLLEVLSGPVLYRWLYGGHPYRFDGSARWLGNRPLLLLEHGNQWGMWSATAALAAVGLWTAGVKRFEISSRWSLPTAPTALLLCWVALIGQSHGALILLLVGIGGLLLFRLRPPLVGGLLQCFSSSGLDLRLLRCAVASSERFRRSRGSCAQLLSWPRQIVLHLALRAGTRQSRQNSD